MADNQFASTIGALFQGMDEFVTTKTVVGEPVTVGDAIILPLVDVTCGMAAGAFGQSAKEKNAGGMSAKMTPSAVLVIQNGMTKVVNIKHQDALTKVLDMAPDRYARKQETATLAAFPYVNGGLFRAKIRIPEFNARARNIWFISEVRGTRP